MAALEYMEKQLQKHRLNYDRELLRGVSEEMLYNIALKISYYKAAVDALRVNEVVRCKECKHWDEEEQECIHWYGFRSDDFCSYGERKDNG